MVFPGPEVIKLEYSLKLNIKCNHLLLADIKIKSITIGCLQTCVREQPIIALYFELENQLEFYYLEAWSYMFSFFILFDSKKKIQSELHSNVCSSF